LQSNLVRAAAFFIHYGVCVCVLPSDPL